VLTTTVTAELYHQPQGFEQHPCAAGTLDGALQDVFLRVRAAERDGLWQGGWTAEQALGRVSDMRSAVAAAFESLLADSGVRFAQPDFHILLLYLSTCNFPSHACFWTGDKH